MAGLSGFTYYKTITISNTNVSADITNGIAYVPVVADTDIGAVCLASGYDVQFSNSDNSSILTFERLAGFTNAGSSASGDFYVLVPTITTGSSTVIRCYYGKAGATDASSPENTFATSNGWIGVWHLEEAAGGPYIDATSNSYDSTESNSPAQGTGKMGYCVTGAAGKYIYFGDRSGLNFGTSTNFSVSAWVYPTTISTEMYITAKYKDVGDLGFDFSINADPQFSGGICDGSVTSVKKGGTPVINTWYHVAWTLQRASATGFRLFIDGTESGTGADPTPTSGTISNTVDFNIMNKNNSAPFLGLVDEVRFYSGLRTPAEIKFERYNSVAGHAAGNELTWGGQTAAGGGTTLSVAVNEDRWEAAQQVTIG